MYVAPPLSWLAGLRLLAPRRFEIRHRLLTTRSVTAIHACFVAWGQKNRAD